MENKDPIICECISKIPGCMSGRATTMTIRACFFRRNLDLLLYQDETGELEPSGIADHDIMDKVWKLTDKIYPPKLPTKKMMVRYDLQCGGKGLSFFTLILENVGDKKEFSTMNAHHCNGNPFDHRIQNGILLFEDEHTALHKAAARGNDALISFVRLLNKPELLNKYVNGEGPVLFQRGDCYYKRESVIREACGSVEAYARLCKAVKENTQNQTEKEKKFHVIL